MWRFCALTWLIFADLVTFIVILRIHRNVYGLVLLSFGILFSFCESMEMFGIDLDLWYFILDFILNFNVIVKFLCKFFY